MSFPLSFQVLVYCLVLILVLFFAFLILGLLKKPVEANTRKYMLLMCVGFCINISALVGLDHRQYLRELELLETKAVAATPFDSVEESIAIPDDSSNHLLTDLHTQDTTEILRALVNQQGLNIIEGKQPATPYVYYLASVDLNQFDVVLDTAIQQKELITTFARRFDVDVAVNGEAGKTPGVTAPLGQWTGNYIVNGKPILMEDTERRPFVYFNKDMKAFYSHEAQKIMQPVADMYNAIWGRFDLIRDGKLAISDKDGTRAVTYPRTVVGMDESGKKMFLMVADGRRPTHSIGLTMEQCGQILLKVGCYQAMACDQGGSSAMYHKSLGIFTRPADGHERVVYTHLGFRRKS
ncbi:MAG: phosphodiester glycosidase family protein [Flavobacteriales bacterium]